MTTYGRVYPISRFDAPIYMERSTTPERRPAGVVPDAPARKTFAQSNPELIEELINYIGTAEDASCEDRVDELHMWYGSKLCCLEVAEAVRKFKERVIEEGKRYPLEVRINMGNVVDKFYGYFILGYDGLNAKSYLD